MKKVICFAVVLLLFISMVLPAAAGATSIPANHTLPLCVDRTGLLTEDQLSALNRKLEEISERQSCEVIAVLTDSCEGKDTQDFADDFFDYNGYGYGSGDNGILLLFAISDSAYAFSTYGFAIDAFNTQAFDTILDDIRSDLKSGNYSEAFSAYADRCDSVLSFYSENGGASYKSPFDVSGAILLSVVAGVLIGLILVFRLRAKNKSVAAQTGAADYLRKDSLSVDRANEMFLYRNVARVERPRSSSSSSGSSGTHTSSSGRTHGGRSGRI